MKSLMIIQSLLLFFLIACSSYTPPHKNLVESKQIKYKYVFGKLDSTGILHERIIYNKKGKDSILEVHDKVGLLLSRTIYYYDSKGKNIKSMNYKPDGTPESKTEYKYSENGDILESSDDTADGGYYRHKYFYNDKRQLIKEITSGKWYYDYLTKWLTSEYISLYLYNDRGYCIGERISEDGRPFIDSKVMYDSLGRKVYENFGHNIRKHTYDNLGNKIEELSFNENGTLARRWVSVYDSNKVCVEYKTFNSLNEPTEVLKTEFIYK